MFRRGSSLRRPHAKKKKKDSIFLFTNITSGAVEIPDMFPVMFRSNIGYHRYAYIVWLSFELLMKYPFTITAMEDAQCLLLKQTENRESTVSTDTEPHHTP